jgi:MFS transporter, DHA1 family, tetracycline resistance protein
VAQQPAQRWRTQGFFPEVRGNARVISITEGVAAMSFQWFRTYASLYMVALGVTTVQLGWLESVLIFTQFVSTLMGGYFADRFGRKRVLVVFDILCWGVPMALYAIARNPWYFLIGRFVNGFVYIVIPSFQCLFVEDVPEEHRAAVFRMVQFLMSAARLMAPVAGWLVAAVGILLAGRVFAVIVMVSSIGIAIYRQFALQETSMGRERMVDTLNLAPLDSAREYLAALRTMWTDRRIRLFVVVRNLITFNTVIWTTYSAIYLTDGRGIGLADATVALFPFVSAVVTMAIILLPAARVQGRGELGGLLVGQLLSVIASLCFVISPGGTIWWAVLWAVASAVSVAVFRPANDSYWANIVGDRERALIFSVSGALTALVSLPAAPLAGMLYTASPRTPFALGIAVQVIALALTMLLRRRVPAPVTPQPKPYG